MIRPPAAAKKIAVRSKIIHRARGDTLPHPMAYSDHLTRHDRHTLGAPNVRARPRCMLQAICPLRLTFLDRKLPQPAS
jgi:hypothetical protein